MNKKTIKKVEEILNRYSSLYTDWISTDDGRIRRSINGDKKYLFLKALLDLVLLIERSLKK
jgi:hypothetical protein